MSRYVEWGGKLIPRAVVEPEINPPKGTCARCGGLGAVPETIDEERYPVMVPCFNCREFCKICRAWKKKGHACG